MPVRLLDVLGSERSRIPTPLLYLEVAAVGTLVGIVLDHTIGWPWWPFPLGGVAAAWLGFMSSAFWGRHRARSIGDSFLMVLAPRRAAEKMERETDNLFHSAPFPLYGLPPSWRGYRFIGGHGESGNAVTQMSLGHADRLPLDPDKSELRVEVIPVPEYLSRRDELTFWLAHETAPRPSAEASSDEMARWHVDIEHEARVLSEQPWREIEIPVDGTSTRFRLLEREHAWIARGRTGDYEVRLEARKYPWTKLALVTVTDVEPYIEGSRKIREESARRHKDES